MEKTFRSAVGLFLAALCAVSSVAQPQAEAEYMRTQECTVWQPCPAQPHSLSLRDATEALAASPGRLSVVTTLRVAHRGWNTDERGGIDVLFSARSELQLVRARASLDDYLDLSLSLHAATQGIASTSSRPPPALS